MTWAPAAPEDLLEIAEHWCGEGTRLGAEYVQAFVEIAADVRLDFAAGPNRLDPAGTRVDRRGGIGLLVRTPKSWWYGSAPLSEPGALAARMAAAGLGRAVPPPPLTPAPPPDLRPPSAGSRTSGWDWHRDSGAAPPEFSADIALDLYRRHRAVVDTRGVRSAWRVSGGRQRCIAMLAEHDGSARAFTRVSDPHWDEQTPSTTFPAIARALTQEAVMRAHAQLSASTVGRRRTPVVFAPKVGAAFLHELIGHALEADNLAMAAEYTTGLRDAVVTSAPLQLVDDPTLLDGVASGATDDEGRPARRTVMVEKGVVAGRLTCVRSEYGDSAETTGHGRRQDYRHAALPRATNTVVLPGPDRAEALLEPPPAGLLYVTALSAGEINLARGQFCFSAAESLLLSPGVPPRPLRDVNIFGDAREALARLTGIGDDPAGDNASCGKSGQSVQIGLYSPTMRFDDLEWRC